MLPSNRIAAHPGRILLHEFLEPNGLTQATLAHRLGIPQNRINELVRGKRGITAETAWLLAGFFKNSAEFWMNLQTAHDLTKVRQEMRPKRVRSAHSEAALPTMPRGKRRLAGISNDRDSNRICVFNDRVSVQ